MLSDSHALPLLTSQTTMLRPRPCYRQGHGPGAAAQPGLTRRQAVGERPQSLTSPTGGDRTGGKGWQALRGDRRGRWGTTQRDTFRGYSFPRGPT